MIDMLKEARDSFITEVNRQNESYGIYMRETMPDDPENDTDADYLDNLVSP